MRVGILAIGAAVGVLVVDTAEGGKDEGASDGIEDRLGVAVGRGLEDGLCD